MTHEKQVRLLATVPKGPSHWQFQLLAVPVGLLVNTYNLQQQLLALAVTKVLPRNLRSWRSKCGRPAKVGICRLTCRPQNGVVVCHVVVLCFIFWRLVWTFAWCMPEHAHTDTHIYTHLYTCYRLTLNQISLPDMVWHDVTLHHIELQHTELHTFHSTALRCIALHSIPFRCIALHCVALHSIALHCVAVHPITSHRIASHRIGSHNMNIYIYNHLSFHTYTHTCLSSGSIRLSQTYNILTHDQRKPSLTSLTHTHTKHVYT